MTSTVLETQRLELRRFTPADAPFILELVNDPSWIRFIGDRKVRSLDDARGYIGKLTRQYDEHGFGLWMVERKADKVPLGQCGLVKREKLADVDLGFAFLSQHRSQGYAREAAEGVLHYARQTLGIKRLVAIVSPDNEASVRLLTKVGFAYESTLEWAPNDHVKVYARALTADSPACSIAG